MYLPTEVLLVVGRVTALVVPGTQRLGVALVIVVVDRY